MTPSAFRPGCFLSIGLLVGATGFAENLPTWPLEQVILESDLVVEGMLQDEATVSVTRVYDGNAKAGDHLKVGRLANLPTTAYEESNLFGGKSGSPTKGTPCVLFLMRGEDGLEPCGWGSGVKWKVKGKVYGYVQTMNPGPYELLREFTSTKLLDQAITQGLKKRSAYRAALAKKSPGNRARALSAFLQPSEPDHYFNKASGELQKLGHTGASVFVDEVHRPRQKRRRRALIIAIGRTDDPKSIPSLLSIIDQAKPILSTVSGAFDWSKASVAETDALSDWQAAIFAAAEIGSRHALPQFREAALWGARHQNQQLLEYALRGMRQAPTKKNLATIEEFFAILPREAEGFGRHAAYYALLALIEHKYSEATPIFVSQLDHPDDYNRLQALRGLTELTGKDFDYDKAAWRAWYEQQ